MGLRIPEKHQRTGKTKMASYEKLVHTLHKPLSRRYLKHPTTAVQTRANKASRRKINVAEKDFQGDS